MAPKPKPILSEEHLNMLNSALSDAGHHHSEVDNSNVNSLLTSLLQAFLYIKKRLDDLEGAAPHLQQDAETNHHPTSQQRLQALEDEVDDVRQRSLKGNIFLTSRNIPAKPGKPAVRSVIKSDEELGDKSLTNHVIDLIHEKYNVHIPECDIQACHRLPHGAVILRIWNRKAGSPWSKLVSAIKSKPVNKSLNFYANFHLTSRRMKVSFFVRQLKQSKQIHQYYTDENGTISIRLKEFDKKKIITFHRVGKEQTPVLSLTEDDIKSLLVSEIR